MLHGYEAIRAAQVVEAGLRRCKPVTCAKCQAACLRGEDHDTCALVATVDTEPIDALAEVFALTEGLATFDIAPVKGKDVKPDTYELHYRDTWHYGSHKYPILVEHRCERI